MRKTLRGFTLVELIIVITVISILATITIVSYNAVRTQANLVGAQADLDQTRKLIDAFKATERRYPGFINNCPTPIATNLCIKIDGSTPDYAYTNLTGDGTYTLLAMRGGQAYFGSFDVATTTGSDVLLLITRTNLKSVKLTFDAKAAGATASNTNLTLSVAFASSSRHGGLNTTVPVTNNYDAKSITFTPTLVDSAINTSVVMFSVLDNGSASSFVPNVKNFRAQLN